MSEEAVESERLAGLQAKDLATWEKTMKFLKDFKNGLTGLRKHFNDQCTNCTQTKKKDEKPFDEHADMYNAIKAKILGDYDEDVGGDVGEYATILYNAFSDKRVETFFQLSQDAQLTLETECTYVCCKNRSSEPTKEILQFVDVSLPDHVRNKKTPLSIYDYFDENSKHFKEQSTIEISFDKHGVASNRRCKQCTGTSGATIYLPHEISTIYCCCILCSIEKGSDQEIRMIKFASPLPVFLWLMLGYTEEVFEQKTNTFVGYKKTDKKFQLDLVFDLPENVLKDDNEDDHVYKLKGVVFHLGDTQVLRGWAEGTASHYTILFNWNGMWIYQDDEEISFNVGSTELEKIMKSNKKRKMFPKCLLYSREKHYDPMNIFRSGHNPRPKVVLKEVGMINDDRRCFFNTLLAMFAIIDEAGYLFQKPAASASLDNSAELSSSSSSSLSSPTSKKDPSSTAKKISSTPLSSPSSKKGPSSTAKKISSSSTKIKDANKCQELDTELKKYIESAKNHLAKKNRDTKFDLEYVRQILHKMNNFQNTIGWYQLFGNNTGFSETEVIYYSADYAFGRGKLPTKDQLGPLESVGVLKRISLKNEIKVLMNWFSDLKASSSIETYSLEVVDLIHAKTSKAPSAGPGEAPTAGPSEAPTAGTSEAPTAEPSEAPTAGPSEAPTAGPTEAPTAGPSEAPTAGPTEAPPAGPSEAPTAGPSEAPTAGPTEAHKAVADPKTIIFSILSSVPSDGSEETFPQQSASPPSPSISAYPSNVLERLDSTAVAVDTSMDSFSAEIEMLLLDKANGSSVSPSVAMERLRLLTANTALKTVDAHYNFKLTVCLLFMDYVDKTYKSHKIVQEAPDWVKVLKDFSISYLANLLEGVPITIKNERNRLTKMWNGSITFVATKFLDAFKKLLKDNFDDAIAKIAPNKKYLSIEQALQSAIQVKVVALKSFRSESGERILQDAIAHQEERAKQKLRPSNFFNSSEVVPRADQKKKGGGDGRGGGGGKGNLVRYSGTSKWLDKEKPKKRAHNESEKEEKISVEQLQISMDFQIDSVKAQCVKKASMWNLDTVQKTQCIISDFQIVLQQIGTFIKDPNDRISVSTCFDSNDMILPFLSHICSHNLQAYYAKEKSGELVNAKKESIRSYIMKHVSLNMCLTSNKPCLVNRNEAHSDNFSCLEAFWYLSNVFPPEYLQSLKQIWSDESDRAFFLGFCDKLRDNVNKTQNSIEERLPYLPEKQIKIGKEWSDHYKTQALALNLLIAASTEDLSQTIGMIPIYLFNLRNIGIEGASTIFSCTDDKTTGMSNFRILYDSSDSFLFHDTSPNTIMSSEMNRNFYFKDLKSVDLKKLQVVVNLGSKRFDVARFSFLNIDIELAFDDLISKICTSLDQIPISSQVALMKHYLTTLKSKSKKA